MTEYSISECQKLIGKYVGEHGGIADVLDEGCLGLGIIVLHSGKNQKTVIIKERFVNAYNCTHTIRKYNKIPKKYEDALLKI